MPFGDLKAELEAFLTDKKNLAFASFQTSLGDLPEEPGLKDMLRPLRTVMTRPGDRRLPLAVLLVLLANHVAANADLMDKYPLIGALQGPKKLRTREEGQKAARALSYVLGAGKSGLGIT